MILTKCAPDCCHGREASDTGRETEQTSDLSSTVRSHNPASGKLERRGRPGHNTARTRPFVRIFWTDGQVDAAGSADNGPTTDGQLRPETFLDDFWITRSEQVDNVGIIQLVEP